MYAKGIEKWQKWPPQDWKKWDEISSRMVEEYEIQPADTGGTNVVHEVYGTAMNTTEDITDGHLLTEAVTKYAARATQSGERMVQMEEKPEEKFSMMTTQQSYQQKSKKRARRGKGPHRTTGGNTVWNQGGKPC